MEQSKMKIELLPHTPFLKYNGKFDKDTAIEYCAKLAGECYEPEGWEKLKNEDDSKTQRRIKNTIECEHSTPYEHIGIGFQVVNIPKILAMVLNNEKQCTTSEKSARYTRIDPKSDKNVSPEEAELYVKWMNIFRTKIKSEYGSIHNDSKIEKLAQENARYLVSVFASTKMIHTVPWIQLNRIVSFMQDYKSKENITDFDEKLINSFDEFTQALEELNVLDERAMSNRKNRSLSLFESRQAVEQFGDTYSTSYKGSFAQLAQAHRHRTIEYSMQQLDNREYFVPPILENDPLLVEEWLKDIASVSYATPQGELVSINERGSYDRFILKTKERLCSAAQLEIQGQTKDTLTRYRDALTSSNHSLAEDIEQYTHGARCTFPDYECARDCSFKEGKTLTRTI